MRHTVHPAGIRELTRSDGVANHLASVAAKAAARARSVAPISRDKDPGQYAAGFDWQRDPGPLAQATFFNRDAKAVWLEFGIPGRRDRSGKANPMPAAHIMRTVIKGMGLRFTER